MELDKEWGMRAVDHLAPAGKTFLYKMKKILLGARVETEPWFIDQNYDRLRAVLEL